MKHITLIHEGDLFIGFTTFETSHLLYQVDIIKLITAYLETLYKWKVLKVEFSSLVSGKPETRKIKVHAKREGTKGEIYEFKYNRLKITKIERLNVPLF